MRHLLSRTAPPSLVLLLAACVPPPTPAPPPAPTPAPAPAATATPLPPPPITVEIPGELPANWVDQPRTEGDWVYTRNAEGSGALFSTPQGQPLMGVSCLIATGRVMVLRLSRGLPQRVRMDVRTETAQRSAELVPAANGTGVGWSLEASDPLLDAIAFSRGHFALGVTGAEPLYPPSYPEITRVIEDCR